jgi:hypothetical protein
MKCNETWDKSINEKHRHNLLLKNKKQKILREGRFLWLTIFLFLCVFCFVLKQGTLEKTNGQKKIKWPAKHFARYSPIVNPPKQAASSPKCTGFMFFFSSSLQRRA